MMHVFSRRTGTFWNEMNSLVWPDSEKIKGICFPLNYKSFFSFKLGVLQQKYIHSE